MAEVHIDTSDTVKIMDGPFMGRIGRVTSIYQPQGYLDDEGNSVNPEQIVHVKIDGLAQAISLGKSKLSLVKSALES